MVAERGRYDLTGRFNLKRQLLWQLVKLLSTSEEMALKIMANLCISTSGEVASFTGIDDVRAAAAPATRQTAEM